MRKIDRNGVITTIAGNITHIYNASSVFQYKNEIYFTDMGSNTIRKISQDGTITTIESGNTSLTPYFIVVVNDELFVSFHGNHMVGKIHLHTGTVETLIGNGRYSGDGSLTLLQNPGSICVDEDAKVYIADYGNNRIRRIDRNGIVNTIAGTGQRGYSGDVPFDFKQYPHIGPKKKQLIKPFPKSLFDITIHTDRILEKYNLN